MSDIVENIQIKTSITTSPILVKSGSSYIEAADGISYLTFSNNSEDGFDTAQQKHSMKVFAEFIQPYYPELSKDVLELSNEHEPDEDVAVDLISDYFGSYIGDIVVLGYAVKDNDDETIDDGEAYYAFVYVMAQKNLDSPLMSGKYLSPDKDIFDNNYAQSRAFGDMLFASNIQNFGMVL